MMLTRNGKIVADMYGVGRAETRHFGSGRTYACILQYEVRQDCVFGEGDLLGIHLDDTDVDALYAALQSRRRTYSPLENSQSPPP